MCFLNLLVVCQVTNNIVLREMTARLPLAWLLLLSMASLCLPLPPLLRRLHRVRPAAVLHTPSAGAKPGILINIEHLNVENPRDLR